MHSNEVYVMDTSSLWLCYRRIESWICCCFSSYVDVVLCSAVVTGPLNHLRAETIQEMLAKMKTAIMITTA